MGTHVSNSEYFRLVTSLKETFGGSDKLDIGELETYVKTTHAFAVSMSTLRRAAKDADVHVKSASRHSPVSVLFGRIDEFTARLDAIENSVNGILAWLQRELDADIVTPQERVSAADDEPAVTTVHGYTGIADALGFVGSKKWKYGRIRHLISRGLPMLQAPRLTDSGNVLQAGIFDLDACHAWIESNFPGVKRTQDSE